MSCNTFRWVILSSGLTVRLWPIKAIKRSCISSPWMYTCLTVWYIFCRFNVFDLKKKFTVDKEGICARYRLKTMSVLELHWRVSTWITIGVVPLNDIFHASDAPQNCSCVFHLNLQLLPIIGLLLINIWWTGGGKIQGSNFLLAALLALAKWLMVLA